MMERITMKDRFYLACFRDNVGSNVSLHAIDGCGYTTDIRKAHVYTKEEAQRAWDNGREFDQPISSDHIDALSVFKVDMQRIPNQSEVLGSDRFAAFVKNKYDGNDVYWLTQSYPKTDFDKALKLTLNEALELGDEFIVIPYNMANKEKRPTFQMHNFNKRAMVQGAGLKTPEHIKRYKRRSKSLLERWNCPSCGRINWQLNPYEFEGCSNIDCSEWSI